MAGAPIGVEDTIEEIERCLYEPGALALEMTPPLEFHATGVKRRAPSYTWTSSHPR